MKTLKFKNRIKFNFKYMKFIECESTWSILLAFTRSANDSAMERLNWPVSAFQWKVSIHWNSLSVEQAEKD